MAENVKLAENVILVDVAYFNDVVKSMKRFFEAQLGRTLQEIYVEEWASFLALDSGLRDGGHKIDVLFVHDRENGRLAHCDPADLDKDLNGVGYTNRLGEFTFTSVSSEELVPRDTLYLDLLDIALNAADVKRLMMLPFMKAYGAKVIEGIDKYKKNGGPEKEIFLFSMDEPEQLAEGKWDLPGYSLMRALGIKAEELK